MAMALGLTFGAWMARHRWYRGHRWCQSAIVLLNAALIGTHMVPSFFGKVYPQIPGKLGRSFYSLATAHAILASGVELAALYLLLAAGTDVVPKRWRLANFKTGMRIVLAGWWLVFLLGLATYARWYVPLKRG
jgi:uncharacterized membrane protein YozB (DUF420 family)